MNIIQVSTVQCCEHHTENMLWHFLKVLNNSSFLYQKVYNLTPCCDKRPPNDRVSRTEITPLEKKSLENPGLCPSTHPEFITRVM